eukprot:IDg2697t1
MSGRADNTGKKAFNPISQCIELKKEYDTCFKRWYSTKFLKGDIEMSEECEGEFEALQLYLAEQIHPSHHELLISHAVCRILFTAAPKCLKAARYATLTTMQHATFTTPPTATARRHFHRAALHASTQQCQGHAGRQRPSSDFVSGRHATVPAAMGARSTACNRAMGVATRRAWESVWGEHMHHGLYDMVDGSRLHGTAAQVRTMDALAAMGGGAVRTARRALDVGCGIGGGSRYLARAGAAHVTALTLSERQAARAHELNDKAGLDKQHITPKAALARECARVLRPGGTLLMLLWCVREADAPFSDAERFSIRRIMEEYCLPPLASPSE